VGAVVTVRLTLVMPDKVTSTTYPDRVTAEAAAMLFSPLAVRRGGFIGVTESSTVTPADESADN